MTTKYIIMADGKAKRWTLDTPKHLVEIEGEPILKRTVRLLGDEDIVITSHNEAYNFAPRYEPFNNIMEIDRFLSNEEIWNIEGDTVFIYGDVFYSEKAIETIKKVPTKSVTFFGRRKANKVKKYGEIFAVKVSNYGLFKFVCEGVRVREQRGLARGLAWDVFRALDKKNFVELDSIVEDFDKPEDLENFLKVYALQR
jgi:choline kinase